MMDWQFETHITAPRESCIQKYSAYLKLRNLCIDEAVEINGRTVRRIATTKPDSYRIGDSRLTLQKALDILEGRAKLPAKKSLPLNTLPLFAFGEMVVKMPSEMMPSIRQSLYLYIEIEEAS